MATDPPSAGGSSRALVPWLEVRTGRHHGVLEVSVLGEIDLANHQALQQLLASLDLTNGCSGSSRTFPTAPETRRGAVIALPD